MNIYPPWWEDTITVYNKFEDPETQQITWYKTEIDNCFWTFISSIKHIATSVREHYNFDVFPNSVICRIPKDEKFLTRYAWAQNANRSNYFTLSVDDILVRGHCDAEINEYTAGQRSADFIKAQRKLTDCVVVQSVQINVGTGKCAEHYCAIGN